MIPTPENLLLIMNHVSGDKLEVIKRIYNGHTDYKTNIAMLGRYWKVKIWYDREVVVRVRQSRRVIRKDPDGSTLLTFRTSSTAKTHVFNSIDLHEGALFYRPTKRATFGWYLPIEGILKYEPVVKKG